MLKPVVAFFNIIHIGMVRFAKGIIIAMVIIIFANVVLRFVFNSGLFWSEEVALMIAVWFSFLAMAIGVKQGLHISISLIPADRLPKVVDLILHKIAFIVVLIVGLVLFRYGISLVGITMRSIMPATKWPSGIMYAIVPFSAVFMIWDAITALLGIDTRDEEVNRYLGGEGTLRDVIGDHHA